MVRRMCPGKVAHSRPAQNLGLLGWVTAGGSPLSGAEPPKVSHHSYSLPDQSWLPEQGDSGVEASTAGPEAGILLEQDGHDSSKG